MGTVEFRQDSTHCYEVAASGRKSPQIISEFEAISESEALVIFYSQGQVFDSQ